MGWRAAGRIKKVTVVPRKEAEAEGTAGMDDRRHDGRGAWMASEGAGHGWRLRRQSAKLQVRSLKTK
jgi:hypothetical protein